MVKFDGKDFAKSAISLAGGMIAVIAFLLWRSGWDLKALNMGAGLPIGVLAFWGIYGLKMKLIQQRHDFVHSPSRFERNDEFSSYRRPEGSFERRTLKGPISNHGSSGRATSLNVGYPTKTVSDYGNPFKPSSGHGISLQTTGSDHGRTLRTKSKGPGRAIKGPISDPSRLRILQGRQPLMQSREREQLDQWHRD